MTTQLNDLAATHQLIALPGTFGAVVAFCSEFGQMEGPTLVVGTLAAALAGGVEEFYSPVLPRGVRLNTGEEVQAADLGAEKIRVETAADAGEPEIIVSGHAGTRAVLASRWPAAAVLEGDIALEQIAGKVVAGTLPPHLVSTARAYWPASVRDFDYSKDGDLDGDELLARLVIGDPVKVTVVE